MSRLRRLGWPVAAALALWIAYDYLGHGSLHEENRLLRKLVERSDELHNADDRALTACDATMVDTLQRLGLDDELFPLMPTLYWRRLTHGLSVSEARRLLKAPVTAQGWMTDLPAMGGPDWPTSERTAPAGAAAQPRARVQPPRP